MSQWAGKVYGSDHRENSLVTWWLGNESVINVGKVTGGEGHTTRLLKLWKRDYYRLIGRHPGRHPVISPGQPSTLYGWQLALLCIMNPDLENWEKKSRDRQKIYKQYLRRIGKNLTVTTSDGKLHKGKLLSANDNGFEILETIEKKENKKKIKLENNLRLNYNEVKETKLEF